MATKLVGSCRVVRDCSMCRNAEACVRSVIVDPLVGALTTWVCSGCYLVYKRAVDSLCRKDAALVVTEVAA